MHETFEPEEGTYHTLPQEIIYTIIGSPLPVLATGLSIGTNELDDEASNRGLVHDELPPTIISAIIESSPPPANLTEEE